MVGSSRRLVVRALGLAPKGAGFVPGMSHWWWQADHLPYMVLRALWETLSMPRQN